MIIDMKRADVTGFEVVSLDGRDLITLDINGMRFDMPVAVAKVLAADLKRACTRATKGGK